jgi:divalent metal cation (Fe/Co/Zn/Cd) transporter
LLCAWLSAALLGGLLLDAASSWSWADPLAALAIAAVAVKEGSRPGVAMTDADSRTDQGAS